MSAAKKIASSIMDSKKSDDPYTIAVTDKQEQIPYDPSPIPNKLQINDEPNAAILQAILSGQIQGNTVSATTEQVPYDRSNLNTGLFGIPTKRFNPPQQQNQGSVYGLTNDNLPEIAQPNSQNFGIQQLLDKLYNPVKSATSIDELQNLPTVVHKNLNNFPEVTKSVNSDLTIAQPKKSIKTVTAPASQTINLPPASIEQPHSTGNTVVVSIPDKKVVVYDKNHNEIASFPAYLGTATAPTPTGKFKLLDNVVPGSEQWNQLHTHNPGNPYGGHFMTFADQGGGLYGFHGWNYSKKDDEIEKNEPGWKTSTHGCVQLSNNDVTSLSKMIGQGDDVTIINTPFTPMQKLQLPQIKPISLMDSLKSLFTR